MSDEPSRRRIAVEVAVFVLVVLLAGAAFVGLRVLKDGPQVLDSPRQQRVPSGR